MFKRYFCVILSLLLLLCTFVGCDNNNAKGDKSSSLLQTSQDTTTTSSMEDVDILSREDATNNEVLDESSITLNSSSEIEDKVSSIATTSKTPEKDNNTSNVSSEKDKNTSNTTSTNSSKPSSTTNTSSTNQVSNLVIKVDETIYKGYPALTESYIYPLPSKVMYEKNSSNIYENQYVKVDATTATKGYLTVTYKDPWAESIRFALDETATHSGLYQTTHYYYYNKGDFGNNKPIALALPKTDAKYYLSVSSEINGNMAKKMGISLGQITVDGYASYQDMVPTPEQIKVNQISKGIYSNKYVKINTNTSSKGYVEVEYIEPNGYDITVSVRSSVKNQLGNLASWTWSTSKKGKCKIMAALPYGNAEYTISVTSSMDNESTGLSRVSKKAELTVSLTNVSKTAPFLLSVGEVQFDSNDKFIKKAKELSATCKNDFEKVSKIYEWLTSYLGYGNTEDTVLGEYKCDLDTVYNRKTGACYDYAVVLAAMLRSQGIPCKVVFGRYSNYTGTGHAWNEVYISGNGSLTTNKLSITGGKWCRLDPTLSVESTGEKAINFMSNANNYIWQSYY